MSKLTWTSQKPTEPGWYWWTGQTYSGTEIAQVHSRNGRLWADIQATWLWVSEMPGSWAGPLEPPKEEP